MSISKNDICTVISSSLIRAQYEYYEMTGRRGFQEVSKKIPEKVLEVSAARSCYQHLRGSKYYIIQEFQFSGFNDAAKDFYGITNCRKFEGDLRRVDIVIKSGVGSIEAIVEIKRKISSTGVHERSDIDRLLEIKNYFKQKANVQIEALFAYPITFSFSNDAELNQDREDQEEAAEAIFGKNYPISVGEYRVKFPDEDFYFCFGAVCGKI